MTGAADYRLGTVCGLMIDDWELGIGDWDWAGDWDWDCEWGLGIGHVKPAVNRQLGFRRANS